MFISEQAMGDDLKDCFELALAESMSLDLCGGLPDVRDFVYAYCCL